MLCWNNGTSVLAFRHEHHYVCSNHVKWYDVGTLSAFVVCFFVTLYLPSSSGLGSQNPRNLYRILHGSLIALKKLDLLGDIFNLEQGLPVLLAFSLQFPLDVSSAGFQVTDEVGALKEC